MAQFAVDLERDQALVTIRVEVLRMDRPTSTTSALSKYRIAASLEMFRLFEFQLVSEPVESFTLFLENLFIVLLRMSGRPVMKEQGIDLQRD